jgi:hypothetical protein
VANSAQPDILARYSLDELREALASRRNKTLSARAPSDLDTVSAAAIADNIEFRQKTIYGHDRRQDFYEIENPKILEMAGGVAGVFAPDRLTEAGNICKLSTKTLGAEFRLCSGQAFIAQPVGPFCSAFVVGSDLVATAGHCLKPAWKSLRIAFGYRAGKNEIGEIAFPRVLPRADVYKPIEIVVKSVTPDYALLRVDRAITHHAPLPLRNEGNVEQNEGVYVLGHPSGLPLKYAGDANVRSVSDLGYFVANLDTFGGNSGSPVLNASTHLVEGILVRGDTDYEDIAGCNRAFVCPTETGCKGEEVTLIGLLRAELAAAPKAVSRHAPITKTFTSGLQLSGPGSSFSPEYVLVSDPAPPGYKIGDFSFSLSGDRACNAWSTCRAAIENDRVVMRFSLQGHNEWPFPGQGKSAGNLVVTYSPQ